MARVYTQRFLHYSGNGGSPTATVPDGERWVIRDLSGLIVGSGSAAGNVQLEVEDVIFYYLAAPAGSGIIPFHWEGRVVANPGDVVSLNSSPNFIHLVVSGYSLALP